MSACSALFDACAPATEVLAAARLGAAEQTTAACDASARALLLAVSTLPGHPAEHSRRVLRLALSALADERSSAEQRCSSPVLDQLHAAHAEALLPRAVCEEDSRSDLWLRRYTFERHGALGHLTARSSSDLLSHGTSAFVWGAGLALAQFALSSPSLLAGRRVLELGSGAGVAGAALALFAGCSRLTLTDGNSLSCANLRRTLGSNGIPADGPASTVCVRELAWEKAAEAAAELESDVVLAADVIYDPLSLPCLVAALRALMSDCALVFAVPRQPATLTKFFDAAGEAGLSVEEVSEDIWRCAGDAQFVHLPADLGKAVGETRVWRLGHSRGR
jgi:predicted nicotinamide N-methyase